MAFRLECANFLALGQVCGVTEEAVEEGIDCVLEGAEERPHLYLHERLLEWVVPLGVHYEHDPVERSRIAHSGFLLHHRLC